jgi:hypothetical protein
MPILVKGIGFDAVMRFAERESGERAVYEALERLGKERGVAYSELRSTHGSAPLADGEAAWHAVFQLSGGKETARSYFRRVGRYIAISNLSTVYRGVLQLIGSPSMMAKRIPTLWQTYFPGVQVESNISQIKIGRYEDRVYGFSGVRYIGAMAEGWLHYAFDLVGAKDLTVNEESTARGELAPSGALAYRIEWRP